MKQGQRKVIEYYMKMQTLYQELDLSSEEEWECSNDSARYWKKVEFEWVFEFLAGLNLELDDVRGRILDWRPFLFVTKVLIDVRLEESRQRVDGALCNADGAPLSRDVVSRDAFSRDALSRYSGMVYLRLGSLKGWKQGEKHLGLKAYFHLFIIWVKKHNYGVGLTWNKFSS